MVRFLVTYITVAIAFYLGNYVAFKKNDIPGWFIGVITFLGLSFLSLPL